MRKLQVEPLPGFVLLASLFELFILFFKFLFIYF